MVDLRKASDLDAKVFEQVQRRSPAAENLQAIHVQKRFLDGMLYTVGFNGPQRENGERSAYVNRVFVRKNSIEVFGHDDDVFRIVGETHSRSFYEVFANGDVVSGIIALVVTVMIVPTFLVSFWSGVAVSVPDWVTSGWLLILGFYFGKASSRSE